MTEPDYSKYQNNHWNINFCGFQPYCNFQLCSVGQLAEGQCMPLEFTGHSFWIDKQLLKLRIINVWNWNNPPAHYNSWISSLVFMTYNLCFYEYYYGWYFEWEVLPKFHSQIFTVIRNNYKLYKLSKQKLLSFKFQNYIKPPPNLMYHVFIFFATLVILEKVWTKSYWIC